MKLMTRISVVSVYAVFGVVWALLLVLSALQLEPVRAHLLRFAVEYVDDSIAGSMRIAKLRGDLLTHGSLAGIELLDPQGRPVGTIAQLDLRYRLAPILGGTIYLETVAIESPVITIGETLAAALEGTTSKPGATSTAPDLHIRIGEFSLTQGTVIIETGPDPVTIRSMDLIASADFHLVGATGSFRLNRSCMSVSTLPDLLCVEASGKHDVGSLEATVRLVSGDQRLQCTMASELDGTPHGHGKLVVENLRLVPWVSGMEGTPLAQPVDSHLDVEFHGRAGAVEGALRVGDIHIDVQGQVGLENDTLKGQLLAFVSNLRLGPPLLPVTVSTDVQVSVTMDSLDRIAGSLDFSRLEVLGLDLSGLHVAASRTASDMAVRVEIPCPGEGRIVADATWHQQRRRATLRLVASSLDLEQYRHLAPGFSQAHGHLDEFVLVGEVDFSVDQPSWQADVAYSARDLAWKEIRIQQLSGEAGFSGVAATAAAGRASLFAKGIHIGEMHVQEAQVAVHRTLAGRTLLAVTTRLEDGTGRVEVAADWPVFDVLPEEIEIQQVEADVRGHSIRSSSTAKVRIPGFSAVELTPLRLQHAGGDIEVGGEFGLETHVIEVLVSIHDLHLAKLLVALDRPAVGGLLSGEIRLHGSLGAPLFQAELHLQELADERAPFVGRLDALATYDGRQVAAQVVAHFHGGGTLSAAAQAPLTLTLEPFVVALPQDAGAQGGVVLAGFELSLLHGLLPEIPLSGTAGLNLNFAGFPAAPEFTLDATVRDLSLAGIKPLDLSLRGSMGADAFSVHAIMEWPGDNAVSLNLDAPSWRLMPAPEPIVEWLVRWTDTHRLTLTADRLLLGHVLADGLRSGMASASIMIRPRAGGSPLEFTASAAFQPGVTVRGKSSKSTGAVRNRVTAIGSFDLLQSMVQADGSVQNVHLQDFAEIFMVDRFGGRVDGTWSILGPLHAPEIDVAMELSRLDVPSARFVESGRLTMSARRSTAKLSARVNLREGGNVRLTGEVPLDLSLVPFLFVPGTKRLDLSAILEDIALENFGTLGVGNIGPGGHLAGTLRLKGALDGPQLAAHLEVASLMLPGIDPLDVTLDATMDGSTAELDMRVAKGDENWARLEARAPAWRLPDDTAHRWLDRWDMDSHHVTFNVENVPLGAVWSDWKGDGQVTLTGSVTKPPTEFEIAVSVTGMTVLEHSLSLVAGASATQEVIQAFLSLSVNDDPVATFEGHLGQEGKGLWMNAPRSAPLHLAFDVTESVRLALPRLGKEWGLVLSGPLAVKGSVDGSLDDLRAEVDVSIDGISVKGVAVERIRLTALLDQRGGQANLDLRAGGAGSMKASVAIESPCLHQVLVRECDIREAVLRGDLAVVGLAEDVVAQFLPRGYLVEFTAGGTLELAGTVKEPRLTGGLTVDVGRLKAPMFGWDTGNIEIRVLADGSSITLLPVVLVVDDGSATVQGAYDFFTSDLSLHVQFDRFLAVNRSSMDVRLDGEIGVKGTLDRPEIYGEIVVLEAHIGDVLMSAETLHPTKLHPDLTDLEDPQRGRDPLLALLLGPVDSQEAEGSEKKKSVRDVSGKVRIVIPGRFFLDAPIAQLELAGDVSVYFVKMQPRIVGEIHTRRGQVDLFGRLFDIERARVVFTGSEDMDPRLDVVANFSISSVDLSPYGLDAGPESVITVTLGGRVSEPALALSSTPSMDEEQILAILVMGSAKGGDGETTGGGAALLAGFLVGPLQSRLARKLPVDTLNVRAGEKGFEDAQVSAGKYITPWLYVRYVHQFAAEEDENSNELHVELRLGRRILLETIYGDAGAGSMDLIYRVRY
jgi:autotransporter translocation and assembly factor TamB